jgi:carboxyl-terminal processing protease
MKVNASMKNIGLLGLGAVSGIALLQVLNSATASTNADTFRLLNLFGDVYGKVVSDYVEKPDEQQMTEAAINGMLMSLDPHSSFMNSKEFNDMSIKMKGDFGGLGIEVTMENGVVKVVSPYDDTPAAKAGLLANDLIVRIDGKDVQGITLNEAVDKMRGPVNTPITLTIMRDKKNPFDVKLIRDTIKIESVKSRQEGDDIGYVRLSVFNEQGDVGIQKALADLDKKMGGKEKGFILDLRGNPGGLLQQAVSISDQFMEKGEVVSTRGRTPDQVERYTATKGDLTGGKPLVVLINGGSASASEIVAGALQDQKRSTTIGTRSFGKGSVQTIIPLGNQGAIRLTTARYYTPSGRSIQAKGIVPDIVIEEPLPPELQGKLLSESESNMNGHLVNPNGGEEGGGSSSYIPPDKANDLQLKAAIDFLHGMTVVTNVKPAEPTKPADPVKVPEVKKP